MITRVLETRLRALARKFPVVTITGPRQSGKTTLCRAAYPDKPYVSLEAPDVQDFARRDPRQTSRCSGPSVSRSPGARPSSSSCRSPSWRSADSPIRPTPSST